MKFSLKWLREHLDLNCEIHEISEKLTSLGLEVENIKNPYELLNDFLVSKIIDIEKHPEADRLRVCKVNNGKETLQIVCGATNAKKGLTTVLAPIGVELPIKKDGQKIKIKKSKIRNFDSYGMLCSEEELGIGNNSNGIIELDNDQDLGSSFSDSIDEELIVFEISITPNRPDCAGVFGIARDLAASGLGSLKLKKKSSTKNDFKSDFKVINNLEETDCPQFLIRLVKNVSNNGLLNGFEKRFENCGIKIISPLVDVTNFIAFDQCRPLHVFDYDKIAGKIIVRHSLDDESFKGLDGETYKLQKGMIVICDDLGVISLAGIMGGERTACSSETKNILIESAYFNPEKISWAGRRLLIDSDARYRFERGIDPSSTSDGIHQASEMIKKFCGGEFSQIMGNKEFKNKEKNIIFKFSDFERLLGIKINIEFVEEKLLLLGCNVDISRNDLKISPPSWRHDLNIKEDIIEEIARLYGYENINDAPMTLLKSSSNQVTSLSQQYKKMICRTLASKGMCELKTWSFVDEKCSNFFKFSENIIKIDNPISSELSCMRKSLLINLLGAVKKNFNRGYSDISIFEIGPVFYGFNPGEQTELVSGLRSGEYGRKDWLQKKRSVDLYDIKEDVLNILGVFNFDENNLIIDNSEIPEHFHPRKSGRVKIGNALIGFFGALHPKLLNDFEISEDLVGFELNFDNILSFLKRKKISRLDFKVSQYQSITRDFSFIINKEALSSEITNTIKKVDKELIKSVKVFDLFRGEDIEKNKKALAVEVIIQSKEKTLNDNEIDSIASKIINNVETKCHAKLRA